MTTSTSALTDRQPSPTTRANGVRRAAAMATAKNSSQITLPYGIGVITVPAPQRLAWYGGVTVVAAVGLGWPWPAPWASSSGRWPRWSE